MTELFLKLVNMSISAGWLILVVLVLRFVFRKTPKWIAVLLWGAVALRLVCPVSIESAYSLIPSVEALPTEILSGPTFSIDTGFAPVDTPVNEYLDNHYFEGMTVPFDNGKNVMTILAVIWMVGAAVLLTYTMLSFWNLRRTVNTAVLLRENIYQSEYVESPFILGSIRPRIYLPFAMEAEAQAYVLAHEAAHIRRRDHLWKPLGFLLLAVYWFNPLIWIAYSLLCCDIELACDEKVIRKFNSEQRANYSETLLSCGAERGRGAVCPLAFGEIGVMARVRSVLNYQKPTLWMVCVSLLFSTAAAACFLTDPRTEVIVPRVPIPGETWTNTGEFEGVLDCDGQKISSFEVLTETTLLVTDTYYIVTDTMAWPMLERTVIVNGDSCFWLTLDLDGDRISEFIGNACDAEGNPSLCIYMRKGDTIYRGIIDTEKLPGFYDYGPGAMWSEYDASKALFRIHYAQKGDGKFAVLETRDLSLFRFEVYRVMPEEVFEYITQ